MVRRRPDVRSRSSSGWRALALAGALALSCGRIGYRVADDAGEMDAAASPPWLLGRLGGSGEGLARALAVDVEGNVYVAGSFATELDVGGGPLLSAGGDDIFIASFTADGGHRWSRRFGSTAVSESGQAVAVGDAGELYLAGYFGGEVDFGGGPLVASGESDGFVARFTTSGAHRWSQRIGGAESETGFGNDGVHSIAARGAVVTAVGQFRGTLDLEGTPLASRSRIDGLVARLSSDVGAPVWGSQVGDVRYDLYNSVLSVAIDGAGGVYFAGYYEGAPDLGGGPLALAVHQDVLLAHFESDGRHQWSRGMGGDSFDWARAIAVSPDGTSYVAGFFRSSIDLGDGTLDTAGAFDAFVASFTGLGVLRWSRRFGGPGCDGAMAIAYGPGDDVVMAGAFEGAVDFGGIPLTAEGQTDVFVARLGADGIVRSAVRLGGAGADAARAVASGSRDAYVAGFLDGDQFGPSTADVCMRDPLAGLAPDPFVERVRLE